jgi:3-dehydroquinate dehydratase
MSIAIITAPDPRIAAARGLPREVVSQLVERASLAGRTVAICNCSTPAHLAACLRRADGEGTEFVLLDPGMDAHAGPAFQDALARIGVPYIQVHAGASRPAGAVRCESCVSVIDGYGAQGYVLALAIALEHLGCVECENPVHVGT